MMVSKTEPKTTPKSTRWYRGTDVPMSAIRRFAREVAKRFQPEKIILFGSHAYGKPHADSDVDVLVVMPCRNELDQAAEISLAIDPRFPLDIIVRTPHNIKWRLAEVAPHYRLPGFRRGLDFLTRYAAEIRYPGRSANKRQAAAALRWAGKVRDACRKLLKL